MLVVNVVGYDERIILSKFERHWRSPENGCRRRKNILCRDFDEEFNGISFRIFGGVLDRFEIC